MSDLCTKIGSVCSPLGQELDGKQSCMVQESNLAWYIAIKSAPCGTELDYNTCAANFVCRRHWNGKPARDSIIPASMSSILENV